MGGMARGNATPPDQKCFICDLLNAHRLGIYNCPEVRLLMDEGLVMFTQDGRLMRTNGSSLPRSVINGGVAKALRDEKKSAAPSSSNLKGKGREDRDLPPHMAAVAGLQSYGRDVLGDDTYAVSSFPTMRSQTKDIKKGNTDERKPDSSPRVPTIRIPPQAPAPRRQVPPIHQPAGTNTPSNPQPHPANTEETWRQRKTVPKPNPTGQVPGKNDVDTQDPNKFMKPSGGYHFTSNIQEMVDGDAIQ
jgi:hypothetical protein